MVLADDQVSVVELPVTMEDAARLSVGAAGVIAGTICAAMLACTNPYPAAKLYTPVDGLGVVPIGTVLCCKNE